MGNFPSHNGTNRCLFLVLKISENWHLEIKSTGNDRNGFVDVVEDIIQHFPKRVNPFRDIWHNNDSLEATNILSENHLLENTPHLKELSKGTRVFSNDGKEDLFNVLSYIRILVVSWFYCIHLIFLFYVD